jgi:hypothetical protein
MPALLACLALVAMTDVHASLGNTPRVEDASRVVEPVPRPEAEPAVASPALATSPRRSIMVETGPRERPVMRLSAMYRVVGRDDASRDNCLKGTGTRLKRDPNGAGACTIGNGQAYIPDR